MGRARLPGCRSRGDMGDLMQLEPFKLEAGDRVRCVDATNSSLREGANYTIRATGPDELVTLRERDPTARWLVHRFKPVVRVKARTIHSGKAIDSLVARSIAAFNALTPKQQEAHRQEQRASWVRGEMELTRLERGETRRSVPRK